MKNRVIIGLLLATVLMLLGRYYLFEWPLRRALPWGASNIHEHSWDDGFLPDYTYHLRADLSRDQYLNYVSRLGLKPHAPSGDPHTYRFQWQGVDDVNWWTPKNVELIHSVTYPDGSTYIGFDGGRVYVYSFDM